MKTRPSLLVVAVATALTLTALAGCTSQAEGLAGDYQQGDDGGNYVSGDGTMIVIPAENRGEPVPFAGDTEQGDAVSSDDFAGRVLVLNFWYATCGPCRTEAPDLVALHDQFADADAAVDFLGVNLRDGADEALTFADKFGIPYPSILDATDNDVVLAFAGAVPPNAVPTTLVIDTQGRVAARISGAIQSPSSVATVVDDLLAED